MTRTPIRRWPIRQAALLAVFAVAWVGALAASGRSAVADAHGSVTTIPAAALSATRSVRVDGYSVTAKCTGRATGSTPTIVLLAGEDDPLSRFSRIQSKLSSLTRVCSYDRLGEGTSSRPRTDQTLADSAAVLHKLLARLHVASHGVVLVGHSLGGLIGARYASLYHSQVKALVLLDASPPSVEGKSRPSFRLAPPGWRAWSAGRLRGSLQATTPNGSCSRTRRCPRSGASRSPLCSTACRSTPPSRSTRRRSKRSGLTASSSGSPCRLTVVWSSPRRAGTTSISTSRA
jgi:pimeloyl-ACP methyl ester carboxylesterase